MIPGIPHHWYFLKKCLLIIVHSEKSSTFAAKITNMALEQAIFRRSELLLGNEAMGNIASKRVIIFGVGGVGSWCAESLVRSGIKHLTIVDSDRVCITNINRQLMATSKTVGQVKVDALKERLLSINPSADITALQQIFTAETADSFDIGNYDYIIDAIDSLKDKALLILMATRTEAKKPLSSGRCKATLWPVLFASVSSATVSIPSVSSSAFILMSCLRIRATMPLVAPSIACVLKLRMDLATPVCLIMSGAHLKPKSMALLPTSQPSLASCWPVW